MSIRQRVNFYAGTASGVIASSSQTTITGGSGSVWPIPTNNNGSYYIPVVLNPGYYGSNTTPEIIYVTAVTGTVATVQRAREGTVAISGVSMPWVAGTTVSDFDVSNLTSTGTLTLNNGLTVNGIATGTASIYAPNGGLSVASGIYAGGAGGNTTINVPNGGATFGGNLIVGNNATITGTLTATTISGTTLNVGGNGLNVVGGTSFYNNVGLNGNNISNVNQITSTTITGTTLNIGGSSSTIGGLTLGGGGLTVNGGSTFNGSAGVQMNYNLTVNGNVSVGGMITTGTPMNGSWYSNTLVNTSYLPNGSGLVLAAVKVTVSGYLRYMIVANSSYINSTGTNCNVWTYITDSGLQQSVLAYTTLFNSNRTHLGNNAIFTYNGTAPLTFSLNVYSDQTTVGRFGTAEISVIGLS